MIMKRPSPRNKAKHASKAKGIIKNYRTSINSAKDMKTAGKLLLDSLAKIEKALV
jgi:hypothetical protein